MTISELLTSLESLRPELAGYLVAKGVDASADEGLASLVDKVEAITVGGDGITPSGSLEIAANGTYDVTQYAEAVVDVPEGGDVVLQEKTVSPALVEQTVIPDEGYSGLSKVNVSAVDVVEQAEPVVTINSSTGLITAEVTQPEGYVAEGVKSVTKQLSLIGSNYIVPGTMQKLAASPFCWTIGSVYVAGDADLLPENIKSGVSIFEVEGSYEGIELPNLTTPAVAAHILSGKQAINKNGEVITGTMTDVGATTINILDTRSYSIQTGYHNGMSSARIAASERAKLIASNIKSGVTILGVTGALETGLGLETGTFVIDEGDYGYISVSHTPLYIGMIPSTGHGGTTMSFSDILLDGQSVWANGDQTFYFGYKSNQGIYYENGSGRTVTMKYYLFYNQ